MDGGKGKHLLKAVETAGPMCLTCLLNFFCFITCSSLSCPHEALSKSSKAVMFLFEDSWLQHLHSSSNAWEKGAMKNEEQVASSLFSFSAKNESPSSCPHPFLDTMDYLFLFRQMGKGSRMRREYL